ncbi:MAG: ABC transporter permease [Ilumatobacteraceae bacterium]
MSELLEPGLIDASSNYEPNPHPDGLSEIDNTEGLVHSMSPGRMAWKRFLSHRFAVFMTVVFIIMAIWILLAPITARYGAQYQIPSEGFKKVSYNAPSAKAWFGTDNLNHDIYSRIIWGGRISMFIGLAVAIVSSVVGTAVGVIAGYKGGMVDDILMRVTDLFLAFPTLVLLLVLRNMFNNVPWLKWLFGDLKSLRFLVVLLVLLGWMAVARIVRGVVMSLKEREFVEAAVALGASSRRIALRHLIPNALGPIIVALTISVVGAIVAESTLSFFGYGVDPINQVSWGSMLSDAKGAVITGYWWMVVYPVAVFVLAILCINFIGDALRDAFDPKQAVGN